MTLHEFSKSIPDFRVDRKKIHPSENIISITIAAAICGAQDWDEIEDFGKCKIDFFSKFLNLENGIPSHDTFNRFFSLLSADVLEEKFRDWISSICAKHSNIIAIDGKTIRGAKEHGKRSLFHMVSAFCCNNGVSLGQVKVGEKTNEIKAIPELLNTLDLAGCIVTIDAMGCQKDIAKTIVNVGANYILAVKNNQKELYEDIEYNFKYNNKTVSSEVEFDFGHGRIEERKCSVLNANQLCENKDKWENLQTIVRIESSRYEKSSGKKEQQIRYYISSLPMSAEEFNTSIRSHWGIENKLHWVLDVDFGEDSSRKRNENSAQNFSIILKIALSKIKKHPVKKSIKRKIKSAGWDDQLLFEILTS